MPEQSEGHFESGKEVTQELIHEEVGRLIKEARASHKIREYENVRSGYSLISPSEKDGFEGRLGALMDIWTSMPSNRSALLRRLAATIEGVRTRPGKSGEYFEAQIRGFEEVVRTVLGEEEATLILGKGPVEHARKMNLLGEEVIEFARQHDLPVFKEGTCKGFSLWDIMGRSLVTRAGELPIAYGEPGFKEPAKNASEHAYAKLTGSRCDACGRPGREKS